MEYQQWIEHMEQPLVAISRMKKPVIAQVHGVAAANGMGLVDAADLAIAATNTKMGLTAINVDLNCVGPIIPVARCVGRKKALDAPPLWRIDQGTGGAGPGITDRWWTRRSWKPSENLGGDLGQKSPRPSRLPRRLFIPRKTWTITGSSI